MNRIYVIHENEAWVEPLRAAFSELSLPFEEWFLDKGVLDFSSEPPRGVFYNRMSASSHTRDHRYAAEYTSCVLPWLELHQRRVVNGSRALRLVSEDPDTVAVLQLATYLTTLMMNYRYTTRLRGKL